MAAKFATAINCMDGRAQLPVIEWLVRNRGIDHVDMITEPGIDGILALNTDRTIINAIKNKVDISITRHDSKNIVLVGHHDCAANKVNEDTHKRQIAAGLSLIRSWDHDNSVEILGIYLNENFEVVLI